MPMTEAQYLKLAEREPERRWELIDGEPVCRPGMTSRHEDLTTYLGSALIQQLDRAEYRVRSANSRTRHSERNWFVPDVMVVPTALVLPQWDDTALEHFRAPLPLVVEVWSPSTGRRDRTTKLARYQETGHAEIWIIHPFDKTLTAWRRQPDGTYSETIHREGVIALAALPAVRIDLDALLADY